MKSDPNIITAANVTTRRHKLKNLFRRRKNRTQRHAVSPARGLLAATAAVSVAGLFAMSAAADGSSGKSPDHDGDAVSSFELVEATIPQMHDAMDSGLLTSEMLVN